METFNSIINASQLTLVDFFATWCVVRARLCTQSWNN